MNHNNHFEITGLKERMFDIFEGNFAMFVSLSDKSEPILMTF